MTINPVKQISKIQIRRGAESDLPGAPTLSTPLVFAPGLSVGEMALTLDNSRVFIGTEPTIGNANYLRTTAPYQNVEILTETSPVIPVLVQSALTTISNNAFLTATLPASTTIWTDINYDAPNGATAFELAGITLSAKIEYFAYDSNKIPVKQGTLKVIHAGGSFPIILVDDSISARRTDKTGAAAYDPAAETDEVIFQVYHNGDGAYRIQYQNLTATVIKIFFQIVRPFP